MPTVFTHAIAGAAIAAVLAPRKNIRAAVLLGAAAAVLPDIDGLGVQLGLGHADGIWRHRGITHSFFFAGIAAAGLTLLLRRGWSAAKDRWRIAACLFAAIASHGMLDAMTTRYGVALLAPYDMTRVAFPFRPILVSPMRIQALFSPRGAAVMASEIGWVWLPAAVVSALAWVLRFRLRTRAGTAAADRGAAPDAAQS